MSDSDFTWVSHALSSRDPHCIRTPEALVSYINRVGFLPLFHDRIDGLSVEEHTAAADWWSGIPERDPWEWREQIAAQGEVAYGKFFGKKAGFISRAWFPVFANYRRDGYDFDSLYEDEKASLRSKKIMDAFQDKSELFSFELKAAAGFQKGGEKNFNGVVTDLQMQTFLISRAFRRRINKRGEEYGWPIAVYAAPESLWGYDYVTGCYSEDPKQSLEKMVCHLKQVVPQADETVLRAFLQGK